MRRAQQVVGWATTVMMAVVALAIFVSMMVGAIDVIRGHALNRPLAGAVEGATNLMAVIVFGSLAYVQRRRGHVRVELFYVKSRPRTQALLDILNVLLLLTFFGLLAWQGWNEAMRSWTIRETQPGLIRFPVYPARFAIVVGAAVLLAQTLLDLVENVRRAWRPPETPQTGDATGALTDEVRDKDRDTW